MNHQNLGLQKLVFALCPFSSPWPFRPLLRLLNGQARPGWAESRRNWGYMGTKLPLSDLGKNFTEPPEPMRTVKYFHIVQNSIWLKKNRASDNEGKFHSFLMYRIWIYSQNLIWHQIMVAFGTFLENWAISLFSSTSALAATRCCLYWSI